MSVSHPVAVAAPLHVLYRHAWAHARGARVRMALALGMLATSQLLKLALPWLAAQAINAIQTGESLASAGRWIVSILGLYTVAWCLHGPARVMERAVAVRVRRSLADALYARLARAPLAWHDAHHSGDLQHRVRQASAALYGFTQNQFLYLQSAINIAGPLVALVLLSQATGLLALVGFAVTGAVILRFDLTLMRLAERENHAERRYAARLLDFVGNISAVASLRLQAATRRLLDQRLAEVSRPLRRSLVINEWKWCAVDLLTISLSWGLVVAYALGVRGAGGETLLIGSLFMVQQYAQQAAGVIGSMASNYQTLARTQTDFAGADLIRAAPEPAPLAVPLPADWHRIELHGLSFQHRGAERGGLHGIHLTLQRGERVALVGPSGAGKSTLLRVMAGLYEAEAGHLAVDGVARLGRRHAGDIATLIPQEAEIFEASLGDNITLDEPTGAQELALAVHTSALDEVLAGLPAGLETAVSERGFNLSGGQRQRLALARGVLAARHSSLLLLDEPTSALDALTERRVHERLDQGFADACIVASVHRLSLLDHFDRVVFMVAGRIVDVGTADELAARQALFASMRQGAATSDSGAAAA